MKVACVLISHLRAKAEMQRRPHLKDQPALIVDRSKSKPVVADHFPAAAAVSPGMPLEQALSHQAGAVVLEADEPHYRSGVLADPQIVAGHRRPGRGRRSGRCLTLPWMDWKRCTATRSAWSAR